MQSGAMCPKSVSSFLRNDFFQKALLLILLSSVIMESDSVFQLFSPSVQIVETYFEDDEISVFRYFGAPIFYNIEVVKTYWIGTPLFPIRGLNLSIPNPSNFSIYDGTKYMPWEQRPFAVKIEADSTLACTVLTNSEGNVTSINVMPLSGSQTKPQSFLKLTYNDMLNFKFISITGPTVNLGNNSISVTMSLLINNTDSRRLYSSKFALFGIQEYGNLTSFTFLENGTLRPFQWNEITSQWLWASFSADPHSYVNFTISTVFQEPLN